MNDIWDEFDKTLKDQRERLIKDKRDIDREINFALFVLGFCIVWLGFCIGLITGYLI